MRYLLLSLILLLSACQRPTVHVFMDALSHEKQTKLIQSLDVQGIHYQISLAGTPKDYVGARLNKFPADNNIALYEQLKQVVIGVGFDDLTVHDFNDERHVFSAQQVGLYLVDKARRATLPSLFYASQCALQDTVLELKSNGRWRANDGQWRGDWRYYNPYMTLRFDHSDTDFEEQSYELIESTEITPFGEKPKLTFTALGHRSRAMPLFNCDFSVVLME